MRTRIVYISAIFLLSMIDIRAQEIPDINDGPYIFRKEKKTIAKWIEGGHIRQKVIVPGSFEEIKDKFDFKFGYRDLMQNYNVKPEARFSFRGVDSMAVISDIHGEFGKYIKLLKRQGIIDSGNNWNFGKGHLIVLGDCFDRGDQVTELLWHVFGLEKQAEKEGGMVHYVLGNHEVMVLGEDLRYMNEKYRKVEEIIGIRYQDLYSSETVLGKWLRNKPIIITINNILFVHGGISTEIIRKKLDIEEINHLFYQMQVIRQVESERDMRNLVFLNEELGPIWYRGYFEEGAFNEEKADSVLSYTGKDHIIVGHTTASDFQPLYGKKILGIDAGLGDEKPGAMLIIKDGIFYEGTPDGKRKIL